MSSDNLSLHFNPFLSPIDDNSPSMPFRDSDAFDLGHPLRSAGLAPGDGDAGITRPHLSRLTQDTASESSLDGEDSEKQRDSDEQEVIVHRVTPKDSLPGVSLRYGIPLAELRRVNQLWTSDSIHLRDVLYIPLQKTSGSQPLSGDTASQDAGALSSHISSQATIQRIPVSQLSFFPPSRMKPRITRRRSLTEQISLSSTLPRDFMRTRSLQSTPSSLPTAPVSIRDVVARLSLDSSRSSRGRDLLETDENHELAIVATASRRVLPKLHFPPGDRSSGMIPPRNGNINQESQMARSNIPYTAEYDFAHRVRPSSPPTSYIPPSSSLSAVRTIQMEPSPIMQIPKRRHNSLHPNHIRKGVEGRRDGWTKMPGSLSTSSTRDTMELQATDKALFG